MIRPVPIPLLAPVAAKDITISADRINFVATETMKRCVIDVDCWISIHKKYEPETQEAIGSSWQIRRPTYGLLALHGGGGDEQNRNAR